MHVRKLLTRLAHTYATSHAQVALIHEVKLVLCFFFLPTPPNLLGNINWSNLKP